jgi:hypothetical protein
MATYIMLPRVLVAVHYGGSLVLPYYPVVQF